MQPVTWNRSLRSSWWLSRWDINPMSVPAVTWPRAYLVLVLELPVGLVVVADGH